MSISANKIRIGNFSSSNNWKLIKKGSREMTESELEQFKKDNPKSKKKTIEHGFIEAGITYIKEKNWERRLGRSLCIDKNIRSAAWGHLMEIRVHELLNNIHYRATGKITLQHPTIDCWVGSPDSINELESVVGDTKGYELKAFCEYVDALTLAKETNSLESLKESHPQEYWQLVSNGVITRSKYMEAIVYVPYISEMKEIKETANLYDGEDQYRFKYIYDADPSELPYLIEGGHYKNLNIFRFEIPQSDKDYLTERVIEASKHLIQKPLIMLSTHCPETNAILIEKGEG